MPYITVGRENSGAIRIYYDDHGAGQPVVLVHGYLADGQSWEKQEAALLREGYRVITYDRRGCGASSRPAGGYDYDTLAGDLDALLCRLDLHGAALIGACFGTGEVIRYLGTYGCARVRGAALLAPVASFPPVSSLPVGGQVPDGITASLAELSTDRPAAIKTYLDQHYNVDMLGGSRVSDQAWQNSFHVAIKVSPAAALGCRAAWHEDFRGDLTRISVPVLIIQGDLDRIAPTESAGALLRGLLADARLIVIPDGPHAIIWTHAAEVNRALLDFLAALGPGLS